MPGAALLIVTAATIFAPAAFAESTAQAQGAPFSLGKIFTFLFLTLGPFKILGPFASMTRGRDARFKRQLALLSFIISLIAILIASTIAVSILEKWGISTGALLLTTGIILFVVALKSVLEQYAPSDGASGPEQQATTPPTPIALAFSPLAFPTIVTPHGIAVLILLATLSAGSGIAPVLGLAGFVLALDVLAMLSADRILRTPFVKPFLGIVGAVLGVLQVALGVQAFIAGLRVLGIVGGGVG
jgi:multiple antibiotic resistance protein